MNPLTISAIFFVFIMGCVTLAGYFVLARAGGPGNLLEEALVRVGEATPKRSTQSDKYERQLVLAGYRQPNAPAIFLGLKIALGLLCAVVLGVVRTVVNPDAGIAGLAMLAGGGLGYLLPDRILELLVQRRARRLLDGIPTAIDLLVLSIEGGQSLDSSMAVTAGQIHSGYPELSGELNLLLMEMQAGRSRQEVFRSLLNRNSQTELRRLAQLFIDSDRFGTSLAPTLRHHVHFLRIRLRQLAYEQARKISVKLTLAVFFFILPAVFLVTLGPALIQVSAQLNGLVNK